MDALRFIAYCILVLFISITPAHAQSSGTIQPFQPVEGRIAAGETQSWTFNAVDGAVVSLVAQATSGDLDPILTVSSSTGGVIISNDDYDYPEDTSAVLEAITLTRRDTYTVTVSGFGDTAGEYQLSLYAGFAHHGLTVPLDAAEGWQTSPNALVFDISDSQAGLVLDGPQQRGLATHTPAELPGAFYAQADVLEVGGREGWFTGLAFRTQDADNYYLFQIDQRGQWRSVIREDGVDRPLRDWVTHPAIPAGQTSFRLSVLARDASFEFFYNHLFLGRVTDATLSGGGIGLILETSNALDAQANARFAGLHITAPLATLGDYVLPQQVITSTSANLMIQDLQRRGLIPVEGSLSLTIQQSSANLTRPGINEILLGGGQTFRNQAIGTTVSWNTQGSGPAGCGLILRAQNTREYTLAYIDQTGGYGVSRRLDDQFEPGIFGENPALASSSSHHLLVIVDEDRLHYYINGLLVGSVDNPPLAGAIGNANVNFEPVGTTCQFTDTWLWSW